MKSLSIIFFLITYCGSQLFSQSINKLDERNGFDKFKLGDSLSVYKKVCKFSYRDEYTKKDQYNYLGGDIKTVFGYKVKTVVLKFYKNKLAEIEISLDAYGKMLYDYLDFHQRLVSIYGPSSPSIFNGQNDYLGQVWTGKKVQLILSGGIDSGNQQKITGISFGVISLEILEEILNSGF